MTDEMTVGTEILQAVKWAKPRVLTPEDYQRLFGGMAVESAANEDGSSTHTINPGGTPPEPYTDPLFDEMFREQMRAYTPAEYQRQLMGVPSTFLEEEPEPEPKPNVWEKLKTWLDEAQTQTINVTRTPRTTYDGSYLAAMCTASRYALTGNPRRGGRIHGRMAAAVIHEDYNRMIREGAPEAGGVPSRNPFEATPSSAPALRMEMGSFNSVRIVRSMPNPDEAETKWAEGVGIGALS